MLSRFKFPSRITSRMYSDLVNEHFAKPRNVGGFEKSEPSVGTAVVGKAACGDVIRLQVKIMNDKIEDVKFKAFGCGSAIASTSFASELIKGMTIEDALRIKNTDIADSLSLPPVKVHCSLLAEDAIKLAIRNYQKKQSELVQNSQPQPPQASCGGKTTQVSK